MSLENVVRAGVPELDGCPILTRIKAFVVTQGVRATLEHVFRDRQGNPVDLSSVLESTSDISAASASDSLNPLGSASLRAKEAMATGSGPGTNPFWDITVESYDASAGLLRAQLPQSLVDQAGIYQLSWAILNPDGLILAVNDILLSVERSVWSSKAFIRKRSLGPPTLNELRMALMDSSGVENLRLDDVEFSDDQLALCVVRPVQFFNEEPPPLRPKYTTRNFPFREHWLRAASGHLLLTAAHNYRRNHLQYQAGGISIDDLNRERDYLAAGQLLLDEWRDFVRRKKVELNAKQFTGSFGSSYGRGTI